MIIKNVWADGNIRIVDDVANFLLFAKEADEVSMLEIVTDSGEQSTIAIDNVCYVMTKNGKTFETYFGPQFYVDNQHLLGPACNPDGSPIETTA